MHCSDSCSMRGFWCSSVLIAGYRYCKVADIQVQSRRWSFDKSNVGVVRIGSFSKRQQGASSNSIWEVLVYEPLLFWRFPFLSWPWRLPVSIGFKAVWQQLGVQVFKITRSPSAGCPKDVRMAVDPQRHHNLFGFPENRGLFGGGLLWPGTSRIFTH